MSPVAAHARGQGWPERALPGPHQAAFDDALLTSAVRRLDRNDVSRFHKVQEAAQARKLFNADDGRVVQTIAAPEHVFVVKHDWGAALGDVISVEADVRMPYPACTFEFRLRNRTVILFLQENEQTGGFDGDAVIEAIDGYWIASRQFRELASYLLQHQVRAACVALDAAVAVSNELLAPAPLNRKREEQGRPLLVTYNVVDLAPERQASGAAPAEDGSSRRLRLHFRRGHWRHLDTHKTWVNWTLVGNPDMGWVDKEYRI